MAKILWTAILLVLLEAAHSYILLTAHIDDIRNIGQRVVDSVVGGQVGHIMRRAYNVFSSSLDQSRRAESDGDIVLAYQPDDNTKSGADEKRRRNVYDRRVTSYDRRDTSDDRHNSDDEEDRSDEKDQDSWPFSALGKSASVYLKKIKKVFENA